MKELAFEQFERLERDHWWFRGRRRVYLRLLADALGDFEPSRVLDVGAGVGGFLQPLSEIGDELHFTELEHEGLQHCRRRGFRKGVRASASRLPYRSESFDLICLFDVIEHVDDDQAVLEEVKRLLRPEGLVLITVPAHNWLFTSNDRIAGHRRRYNRGALRRLFDDHAMSLERCTYANALLFPAIAGFLLAARLFESLGLRTAKDSRTNLSWRLPAWVHAVLYRCFAAELWISRHWDLPMGHSILALAKRRDLQGRPLILRPMPPRKLKLRGARAFPAS